MHQFCRAVIELVLALAAGALIAAGSACAEEVTRVFLFCSLEGVFWHTGENDTYSGPYCQNYAKWLKQLIEQVRLDLQQPDLRWFISEQHPNAIWRNMDLVNAALNTLAQSDQRITLIKTAHLPHARLHFGTRGTLLLGQEMAHAYLKKP